MTLSAAYFAPAQRWEWRVDIITDTGEAIQTLASPTGPHNIGLLGGKLEWSIFTQIRDSGSLEVRLPSQIVREINWDRARVRVALNLAEPEEIPHTLGHYLVSMAPEVRYRGDVATCQLDLHGRTTLLLQEGLTETLELPAGTVITDAIATLLAHIPQVSITPSTKALSAARSWEPTSENHLLRIINDLAEAAGYFAVHADPDGWIRLEPYTAPGDRALAHTFADDERSVYTDDWHARVDTWAIPNRIRVIQRVSGEETPLFAVITDEHSRYGTVNRGRIIDAAPIEAEASTLDELRAIGWRRLVEAQATTETIPLTHGFIPIREHDAVRFVNSASGITADYAVAKRSMSIGSPLVRAEIRRTLQ